MDDETSGSSSESNESKLQRSSRGRGNDRGRCRVSRSRGRRGLRGRGRQAGPTRHEAIRQRREERLTQLTSQVEHMSTEGLMELVMQVCERDPSRILNVVDHTSQEERSRRGYHPLPDGDSPAWCVCGRCREMPSEEERECCRQTPENCFSLQPDFDFVVTDPLVLLVARRYREDVVAAGEDQESPCCIQTVHSVA